MGSILVENVFSILSFFLFTFVAFNVPCIIVFQIITLSDFFSSSFTKSFMSSSCSPLSRCRCDKPKIPLSGFSGPSVWPLGGDPQGLSPFRFLLCLDPIWNLLQSLSSPDPVADVVSAFFISFFFNSSHVFNTVFYIVFFDYSNFFIIIK